MNYYLYRITNKVNGKIYVGVHKTRNLDDGYMSSGKIIVAAINKYGIENFEKEILEYFDNAASMFEREKEIVNEDFLERNDVYNLRRGGYGGFEFINSNGLNGTEAGLKARKELFANSPEWRSHYSKVRSEAMKHLAKDPAYGRKVSAAQKKAGIRLDLFRGRKHTDETKAKLSESAKVTSTGKKNSQRGSFWITNGTKSKKHRGDLPEGWKRGRKMPH